MKRTFAALAAFALAVSLTACTNDEASTEGTSSATTSATSTTTKKPVKETIVDTPTPESIAPEPTTAEVYATPVEEPTIVECLEGTPGPTLMSDGTIQMTDYCFYALGGPEYAEQESQSGLKEDLSKVPFANGGTCAAAICGYGTDENGNPNPSSGELQTQDGCEQGYITDAALCAAVDRKING